MTDDIQHGRPLAIDGHGAECFADRTSLHRPPGRCARVLRFVVLDDVLTPRSLRTIYWMLRQQRGLRSGGTGVKVFRFVLPSVTGRVLSGHLLLSRESIYRHYSNKVPRRVS